MFAGVNYGPDDLKRRARQVLTGESGPWLPRHLVAWPRGFVDLASTSSSSLNSLRSLNWGSGLGSSLSRPATANALPAYLQQSTCLSMARTAGQCIDFSPLRLVGHVERQVDRFSARRLDFCDQDGSSISVATTCAAPRANVSPQAAPIPEAAPVTIATLPFS
jgi:hypothetical protein